MDVILVLFNIRSAHNTGAILRTAEGTGVREVVLAGWTPRVMSESGDGDAKILPHIAAKMAREIAKTALGAEKMVKIRNLADLAEVKNYLKEQKRAGWRVLALENNVVGRESFKLSSESLKTALGRKAILVVGEEVNGINPELLDACDCLAEIPMYGRKESFNVSVATGMALYELRGRSDR